jgi:hypothetical protein
MNRRKLPSWRGVEEPVPSVVEGTPAVPVSPTPFWPFQHGAYFGDGPISGTDGLTPNASRSDPGLYKT